MKKYIVTGGAGFIGSSLVRGLLALGDGLVEVIDDLSTGHAENLADVALQVELHRVDIRDYAAIEPIIASSDTVFHIAAIPSVPKSIVDPVPSHEANIDGTFNVLRACVEGKSARSYTQHPLPRTEIRLCSRRLSRCSPIPSLLTRPRS